MIKHIAVSWSLAFLFFAAWFASFDVVTEYEVKFNIRNIELKVNKQIIKRLNREVDSLTSIIHRIDTVTATVYYPTGHEMRSGKHIPINYHQDRAKTKYIAISQDLWDVNGGPYSFGDSIRVIGTSLDAIYVIEDTMNKRHRNRVDILVSGKINEQWYNVKIYKV